MNYQDTTNWLFSQLPMYQNEGKTAYKADLSNIRELDNQLNSPHRNFKSIHVAGTNGKGSTSHMLASVFQEAGYKVGLYTSPHLQDYRERIKINGRMISKNAVIGFVKKHRTFFETHNLSFFEMTVGMAFEYFSKKNVDIAIIEVGLGGRLDSTNIITPELSIITNIGLDHTKFLGNSIAAIAKEKAGIVKPNIPVVIGESTEETSIIFKSIAVENNSEIYFSERKEFPQYPSDLKGDYQKYNKRTVVQAINVLQKYWEISQAHIKAGLNNTIKNTGLLGRWQILKSKPLTLCDTAHNKEGLTLVLNQLQKLKFEQLHIVLGVVNDKDLENIIPLFPTTAKYYFCKPNVPRGLDPSILKSIAETFNLYGEMYDSVMNAYNATKVVATEKDTIFIGGSTFVVAEVL